MNTKLLASALITFISIGSVLAQPVVSRGPYLNIGTTSSMIVRWRTDVASDTKIWYGTTTDTASMMSMVDTSSTMEHEVQITGLSDSTVYYYAIGTTSAMLAGADNGHYFKTSPPVGAKQPIRVWGIGDFGEGNANQAAVRDAYKSYSNNAHTDVWVWFGDNAYDDGLDSEYQTNAFDMYPEIFAKTVVWPSLGNHDYGGTHPVTPETPDAYLDAFTLPMAGEAGGEASGTELYYSYDYGNVHFISINSEAYTYGGTFPNIVITHDPAMLTWLENDLANNTNTDWIIAYLHAPPYADGTHTENYTGVDLIKLIDGSVMRGVRDYVVPILENYGVDVVIGGHSHDYERSYFTYGNYGPGGTYPPDSTILDGGNGSAATPYLKLPTGPNANKGAVFCVVGCSAKTGNFGGDGPLNHELMYTGDYRLGSLMLEIEDDRLDGYFIDTTGTAWDQFTILKTLPDGLNEVGEEASLLKVFPNPFSGQLSIEYTLEKQEHVSLDIIDLSGKKVYTIAEGHQEAGPYKFTVDAERTGLVTGVYLLRFKTEGTLKVQRTIRL